METSLAEGKCAKDACVAATMAFATGFTMSYVGATKVFDSSAVLKRIIDTAFSKTFTTFATPTLIGFMKTVGATDLANSLSCH
jgi:hypothetical protein